MPEPPQKKLKQECSVDKKSVHLHYTTQRRKRRGFQRFKCDDARRRDFAGKSIQDTYKKDSDTVTFLNFFAFI